MKKKKDHERIESKRDKNLVLKTDNNESSDEDADKAYLTKRFQKMVRKNGGIPKNGNSSKPRGYDLCHKCGKKDIADNVVKQALAAWGDSSSESGEDDNKGDISMMAVESEATEYDSIFTLMAQSDDDEDDDEDEKLISLDNVLIDAYHSLINDKNALTTVLGEIEHERDDLVVVAVDQKETIESLKREKDTLTERIANIEHERDGLLVVVVDLKETIEELKREGRHEITQKGKEFASEAHLRLEDELKSVKSSLCAKLERNRQL
uniref:Kinesin-related protein 4-like n=1 Tax=Nicotiana tabacum TaxID=4097 RepID=A0A1S3XRW0_TOBAC|nr:PREDICTED: kinesin-related protein 4-like [Nicotiana tabacum]